ncbi:MAG: hypothetical protein UT32_C0002G0087 [Parcubacteria group bacterium GW2011_GWC2_39_14]|nr:MAG: hypothetical protein UT32_C0002G0087 [Parcubacteria group bacterium GW2011_GWC2_39_14]KKR55312.1 MAG: hypothetical protein UT91_C0003G0087 [Parcubacteria group bacterium GW2011_GWA2_40_23]
MAIIDKTVKVCYAVKLGSGTRNNLGVSYARFHDFVRESLGGAVVVCESSFIGDARQVPVRRKGSRCRTPAFQLSPGFQPGEVDPQGQRVGSRDPRLRVLGSVPVGRL